MYVVWDPLSIKWIQGVISVDTETLCSPELLTENTETLQQKKPEILCLDPKICFEGSVPGMAWVHLFLRSDWNVHSQPWKGLSGQSWPFFPSPYPQFPSPSFYILKELACCSHLSCFGSLSQIQSFKITWPDRLEETFTPLVRWLTFWHCQCVSTDAC